jgi:hypothetical protein
MKVKQIALFEQQAKEKAEMMAKAEEEAKA